MVTPCLQRSGTREPPQTCTYFAPSTYSELSGRPLPYRTPRIRDVLEPPGGLTVSIEGRLPGVPLHALLIREPDNDVLRREGMRAVVSVVTALDAAGDVPAARELALLGVASPWSPDSTYSLSRKSSERLMQPLGACLGTFRIDC